MDEAHIGRHLPHQFCYSPKPQFVEGIDFFCDFGFNGILDAIREQIQQDNAKYLGKLPIFKKSTYYLAGYMYASRKTDFDTLQKNMTEVFQSDNEQKLRGMNFPNKVTEIVKTYFDAMVTSFIAFYNNLKDIDKTDIDNLLKNKSFDEAYKKELETMIGKLPDIED
jgi:hypothetical protein